MANDPGDALRSAESADNDARAPLSGSRSQSMQRLQIGLFGLATMILLVALANIIITNLRRNEARVVPEAAPTVAAEATVAPARDPLAEAGVVPDVPADPQPRQRSSAGEGQAGDASRSDP